MGSSVPPGSIGRGNWGGGGGRGEGKHDRKNFPDSIHGFFFRFFSSQTCSRPALFFLKKKKTRVQAPELGSFVSVRPPNLPTRPVYVHVHVQYLARSCICCRPAPPSPQDFSHCACAWIPASSQDKHMIYMTRSRQGSIIVLSNWQRRSRAGFPIIIMI